MKSAAKLALLVYVDDDHVCVVFLDVFVFVDCEKIEPVVMAALLMFLLFVSINMTLSLTCIDVHLG